MDQFFFFLSPKSGEAIVISPVGEISAGTAARSARLQLCDRGVLKPADRAHDPRECRGAPALRRHASGPRHALHLPAQERTAPAAGVRPSPGAGRPLRRVPCRRDHRRDRRHEDPGQREQARGGERASLPPSGITDQPKRPGSTIAQSPCPSTASIACLSC